jgi:hypothetical protein
MPPTPPIASVPRVATPSLLVAFAVLSLAPDAVDGGSALDGIVLLLFDERSQPTNPSVSNADPIHMALLMILSWFA